MRIKFSSSLGYKGFYNPNVPALSALSSRFKEGDKNCCGTNAHCQFVITDDNFFSDFEYISLDGLPISKINLPATSSTKDEFTLKLMPPATIMTFVARDYSSCLLQFLPTDKEDQWSRVGKTDLFLCYNNSEELVSVLIINIIHDPGGLKAVEWIDSFE